MARSIAMTGWSIAIDFGTTFTSAAVLADGRASVLELDGATRMPSMVLLDEDGLLIVGRAAEVRALGTPDLVDRNPKRSLGRTTHLVLGGKPVPVVDAVGAVLGHVAQEASRRRGGTDPDTVILTHPVRFGDRRLDALVQAAGRAGLANPRLLAEPVAAAMHYVDERVPLGGHVAVYDLGGGTFDTAILRRTADTFELAGQPGGSPDIGGEQFDEMLFRHVGETLAEVSPDVWERLAHDDTRVWRRHALELRAAVRTAKEALSSFTQHTLYVAPADIDVRLTRAELEVVLRPALQASVDELLATVVRAGLRPDQLAAVYLVGGSSRIPLVARLVAEALGVVPTTYDDPKCVVVLGAAEAAAMVSRDAVTDEPPPSPRSFPETPTPTPGEPEPRSLVPIVAPPLAVPPVRPGETAPKRRRRAVLATGLAMALLVTAALVVVTRGDDETGRDGDGPVVASGGPFACAIEATVAPDGGFASPTVVFSTAVEGTVRASPHAAPGAVVVATEEGTLTILGDDGTLRSSIDVGASVVSDLAGNDDVVVVADEGGHLRAFGLQPDDDADARWDVDLGQPLGNPTVSGDTVYVGGARGRVFAVDLADGARRWDVDVDGAVFGAPEIFDGGLYATTNAGRLVKASLDTHEIDTSRDLPAGSEAGPAVVGDVVVVAAIDGSVHAFGTGSLDPRWDVQVSSEKRPVYASPAAEGGSVFVGSNDCGLYALDVATGAQTWRHAADGAFDTALAVSGLVYASSDDGSVVAVQPDGQVRWRYELDGPPTAPVVAAGRVYVATLDGGLVSLQAA